MLRVREGSEKRERVTNPDGSHDPLPYMWKQAVPQGY